MNVAQSTFSNTLNKLSVEPEVPATPAPSQEETVQPTQESVETPAAEPTQEQTPTSVEEGGEPTDMAEFNLDFEQQQEQQPQQEQPLFNIDEEIKKIDRADLLKKAGVSDFLIELDSHLSKGGKAVDYLQAKAVDYNTISDEDLIKADLKAQYPNLSNQQIDIMFSRNYGVDENSTEDDRVFAETKLAADGYKIRQNKISEQQKFKLPEAEPLVDEQYQQWKQQSEQAQQRFQEQINFYNNHTATKALNESKRVTINVGEGIKPLNFNLDNPELITKALTDDGTIMQKILTTQTGEPDVAKEHLVTLFAFNPTKFIQTVFNYGMQQGVHKKLVGDNQNAQRPNAAVLPISPDAKPSYKTGTYGNK